MKNEIRAALIDVIAGPFIGLHQAAVYRALEIRAESTLASDLIGALARVLALLALFVPLPGPVVLATLAVVIWAALAASVDVAVSCWLCRDA